MPSFTFNAPSGVFQGTHRLPDGVSVTVTAGQASVPDTSWHAAVRAGFQPPSGTTAPFTAMTAPAGWTGNLMLHNGTSVAVTAGVAQVPAGWTSFAASQGFQPTYL